MIKLSYEQQIAFNSLSIIVGNALYALTVVLFLVPSGLITGGATGIALGINRALGLPVSGVLFVINMTMLAVGWVLLGRLLRPIPAWNVRLVIAGRGAGEELEQTVRGLMWLRGLGLLSCPVVIADVDLTPQGWELALRLTLRWPDLALWPASALEEYICQVRN